MTERPRPPGPLRVVWLVVALHARRLWNVRAVRARPTSEAPPARRGATPTKRSGLGAVLLLALLGVGFQTFRSAASIVSLVTPAVAWTPGMVGSRGADCLDRVQPQWRSGEELDPQWDKWLRRCLDGDLARFALPPGTTTHAEVERAMARFAMGGRSAFRTVAYTDFVPFPSADLRPPPEAASALGEVLAALALACVAMLFLMGIGIDREDLAKADGLVESLYQTPVSARTLHLALLVRRATVSFFLWGVVFPLWIGIGVCVGLGGWTSIGAAAVATAFFGILAAAGQVVAETLVRLTLRPAAVRRVQAVASLLGSVAFGALMLLNARAHVGRPLLALAPLARVTPPAAAARLFAPGGALGATARMAAWSAVFVVGALVVVERLLARGLISGAGNLSGARGAPRSAATAGVLGGVPGKDLRLLLRDPNLLMQALFAPLFLVAMQAFVGNGLAGVAGSSLAGAVAGAFFVAAYGYAFGAANVLVFEGPCLWILYTLPHAVGRLLRDKVKLWGAVGLATSAAVFAFAARGLHATRLDAVRALAGLAGVLVYAYIAAGIGVFATDPLAQTPARRQKPGTMLLYFALVSGFTRTLYDDAVWGKLVALVLSGVLAVALWQKVDDRLPYLLDPTEAPPPSIAVSDGVIAVVAYFFLQTVFVAVGVALEAPLGATIALASAAAGALVAAGALLSLRSAKVKGLLVLVGLRRDPAAPPARLPWPLVGAVLGLTAAGVAVVYMAVGQRFEPFREALERMRETGAGVTVSRAWLGVFAVGVAPLVEELIFRGLIFRALRRSWPRLPAALASAALFAICHPPLATAPVFVLGVAAALAVEVTGLLWTSVVAHAVYNAVVLFAP